jgi:hypothetical protein
MNRTPQTIEKPKKNWTRRAVKLWRSSLCKFIGHNADRIVCYHKSLVVCDRCGLEIGTSEASSGIDTLHMYCQIRLRDEKKGGELNCTSLQCPKKKEPHDRKNNPV